MSVKKVPFVSIKYNIIDCRLLALTRQQAPQFINSKYQKTASELQLVKQSTVEFYY